MTLSSLAARSLASGTGENVGIAAPVAAVLHGLTDPVLLVEISALTQDAVDAAHVYIHDQGAFLLSQRAYGVFEIQGLRSGASIVDLLMSATRRFTNDPQSALVACRIEADAATGSVALATLASGTWVVSREEPALQQSADTLDEALRLFAETLADLLPTASVPSS